MQFNNPDLLEVRVYGLNIRITAEALGEFLGKGVRVLGILLHPPTKGSFQWAQVWVGTEAEVVSLLGLRDILAANGITVSRAAKTPTVTPPQTTWDLVSQLTRSSGSALGAGTPAPAARSPLFGHAGDTSSSLPRNLYILNLPLDLTQIEFKDLFTPFGIVEHSILLSQLDGIGRRRGFVLMSIYREALEVMHQMHGKWIDGFKLDVSWALVQRETRTMPNNTLPNRVVHPPAVPTRREPSAECVVVLDNLDPHLFPDTETISSVFRSFGPIYRVVKLTDSPLSVLIHFEHAVSAKALINSNNLRFGERLLSARGLGGDVNNNGLAQNNFDPFADISAVHWNDLVAPHPRPLSAPHLASRRTRLNAQSQPFVPSLRPMFEGRYEPQVTRKFPITPTKGGEIPDHADLSLGKISSDSNSPNLSTSSAELSAAALSVKSQRSDTTVVGDE